MRLNYKQPFVWVLITLLLLNGCVQEEPYLLDKSYGSSHIKVPFIPPRSDLCAATSLEMISLYWQSKTSYVSHLSREKLDGRTLIPGKGGTLQVELMATARANGLLVYLLPPTFKALLSELEKEHPIIVLVNRGYSWYPLWHYVTVTGYNRDNILMHFSDKADEALSIDTFKSLWKRSENWGVILLPPEQLPTSVSSKVFLRSVYTFEKSGNIDEAIVAYKSALKHWYNDSDILFALANAYYNAQELNKAEQSYRKLLSLEPKHVLALNNLADLLCRKGSSNEALRLIRKAVTDDKKIQSILNTTHNEIMNGC